MVQLLMAIVLIGLLLWVYLGGKSVNDEEPRGALETYHQAEEAARSVESTMQNRAEELERQLQEQQNR